MDCLGWTEKEPITQQEVVLGVVIYAPYFHHFEAVPVHPQDVVPTCPHRFALSLLHPHIHVPVLPVLSEVVEEVHQTKLHHQVSNLLTVQVLGFADVGAEVTYQYVILAPEAWQGLL